MSMRNRWNLGQSETSAPLAGTLLGVLTGSVLEVIGVASAPGPVIVLGAALVGVAGVATSAARRPVTRRGRHQRPIRWSATVARSFRSRDA